MLINLRTILFLNAPSSSFSFIILKQFFAKLIMFLENTINHSKQSGWMEVICGSMFSGKTEELIRRLRRAEMAGQNVEIFKPKIDTRYC